MEYTKEQEARYRQIDNLLKTILVTIKGVDYWLSIEHLRDDKWRMEFRSLSGKLLKTKIISSDELLKLARK